MGWPFRCGTRFVAERVLGELIASGVVKQRQYGELWGGTELSLLDTTEFRVDIIEPEKLFLAALQNVINLGNALGGAIRLAIEARVAVEVARRATPPLPGFEPSADVDPLLLLRGLERIAEEIDALGRQAKIA